MDEWADRANEPHNQGGVAIGVARYRLFELEGWAFGVLFYVAGVLLLVLLDAFLIFVLSLDRVPALGLSLMAVALLYLPLRDALHRRIVGNAIDHSALFQPNSGRGPFPAW